MTRLFTIAFLSFVLFLLCGCQGSAKFSDSPGFLRVSTNLAPKSPFEKFFQGYSPEPGAEKPLFTKFTFGPFSHETNWARRGQALYGSGYDLQADEPTLRFSLDVIHYLSQEQILSEQEEACLKSLRKYPHLPELAWAEMVGNKYGFTWHLTHWLTEHPYNATWAYRMLLYYQKRYGSAHTAEAVIKKHAEMKFERKSNVPLDEVDKELGLPEYKDPSREFPGGDEGGDANSDDLA